MSKHHFEGAGLAVLTVIVVIGLCIGGWFGYWALAQKTTNRTQQISRNSFEFQQARVEKINSNISDIENVTTQIIEQTDPSIKAQLAAQKIAMVSETCGLFETVESASYSNNPIAVNFRAANCN